ncbi:hypothetical protein QBC37DRAFT_448357 [Rhypophila decipiens]|uniref:Uncharacterized protein n=1 Tax=Rhypophila decipiens TaxID=261697 RepID=A0AAN7B550_9PEZI|nr:hypothetical protein QBC37DRAFT_448357 [Rhypophila decipiens]
MGVHVITDILRVGTPPPGLCPSGNIQLNGLVLSPALLTTTSTFHLTTARMHFLNPVVLSSLGLGFLKVVLADDLELKAKDVPAACQAICAPIVQLTKSCDIDSHVRRQVRKRGPISRVYRRIPDDQHDDTDDENDGNVIENDDGHLTDNDDDNDGNITDNDNDDDGHLTDNDDDKDDGHLTDNDGHLTDNDDDNDGNITDNDGHDTDDEDHDTNSNVNASASANIDDHSDDEDAAERDCICLNKSFDVPKITGLCASCIAQNFPPNNNDDDDDDALEDINKIMAQCGFPSTTYAPEATTAVTNIIVSATRPAVGDGGAATTPTSTPIPTAGLVSGGDSVKVKGFAAAAAGALALAFAWA